MNYEALKAAWSAWMHRDDLVDVYDTIAAIIVARLSRTLRTNENEVDADLIIDSIELGLKLPDDFRQARIVTSSQGGQALPLDYASPVQWNESGIRAGRPCIYTITKGYLFIKGAGEVVLTYWKSVDDIVITTSSPTLAAYPDLYVYAGLEQLHRHVQNREAQEEARVYVDAEIIEVNKAAEQSRRGNRPVMRRT